MLFGFFLFIISSISLKKNKYVDRPNEAESKKGIYQIGGGGSFIHKFWNRHQVKKFL